DAWFAVDITEADYYSFFSNADFAGLSIYADCSASPVVCDHDSGRHLSPYVQGYLFPGRYLVRLATKPVPDGGPGLFTVSLARTPSNDECDHAQPVTLGQTSTSNIGASGGMTTDCGLDRFDVWYAFTAPASGWYRFETSQPLDGRDPTEFDL